MRTRKLLCFMSSLLIGIGNSGNNMRHRLCVIQCLARRVPKIDNRVFLTSGPRGTLKPFLYKERGFYEQVI